MLRTRNYAPVRGLVVLLLATALGACAGGDTSSDAKPGRTVDIEMSDIAFSPSELSVREGETIRFVFRNAGATQHDAFFGNEREQREHEAAMRSSGKGESHHGDSADSGVTVQPGKTADHVVTFDSKGTQIIGCHEPGHYAEGMKVTVTVS